MLMAVTIGLVWLLSVGAAQVRTVDAARETARAVARGDDEGAAVAVGERVAPEGVRVAVSPATAGWSSAQRVMCPARAGCSPSCPAPTSARRRSPSPRRSRDDRPATGRASAVRPPCWSRRASGCSCSSAVRWRWSRRWSPRTAPPRRLPISLPWPVRVAARDGGDPCAAAGSVAADNGARLTRCSIADRTSPSRSWCPDRAGSASPRPVGGRPGRSGRRVARRPRRDSLLSHDGPSGRVRGTP